MTSSDRSAERPAGATIWCLLALQLLVIAMLVFGDIGFDKPGKYGLDFGHFLALIVMQGCLCIPTLILLVRKRSWRLAYAQIGLVIATAMVFW